MSESIRVPLGPAYHWDCPSCGRSNFQRAVASIASAEETKDHLVTLGALEAWQEVDPQLGGVWFSVPEHVHCRRCGSRYQTQDWRAAEEGDDG